MKISLLKIGKKTESHRLLDSNFVRLAASGTGLLEVWLFVTGTLMLLMLLMVALWPISVVPKHIVC